MSVSPLHLDPDLGRVSGSGPPSRVSGSHSSSARGCSSAQTDDAVPVEADEALSTLRRLSAKRSAVRELGHTPDDNLVRLSPTRPSRKAMPASLIALFPLFAEPERSEDVLLVLLGRCPHGAGCLYPPPQEW